MFPLVLWMISGISKEPFVRYCEGVAGRMMMEMETELC